MTLLYAVVLALGLGMIAVGLSLVVAFLVRSRADPSRPAPQRRAETGAVTTQRAVLGALLVTAGFFFAVFGALLSFAPQGGHP